MLAQVKQVLLWEFRLPLPIQRCWQRWIAQLPPGFWPAYRWVCLAARFLLGAAIVASQVGMAHYSFTNGNVGWGCWQATFAILSGAYIVVVFDRKFRQMS